MTASSVPSSLQRAPAASAGVRLTAIWRCETAGLEVRVQELSTQPHAWVMDRFGAMLSTAAERWWYRGAWQLAAPGQLRLLEPDEVVQCQPRAPSRRVLVLMEAARLQRTAPLPLPRVLGFSAVRLPAMDALLRPLLSAATLPWHVQETAEALATALVPHHVRYGAPASEESPAALDGLVRARTFLLREQSRLVSLDELAAVAQLSRFHLARRFSDEVGMPPHLFHLHVRVARARMLLVQGADSSSIAQATGFADQAHLTRWFTRVVGISPGRYQRLRGIRQLADRAS